MTGVIAAAMAALLGAASALGAADCSGIIQEAENRVLEAQLQEEASRFLVAIDAGHQGQGNFGQEPIGPGASETKTKVAAGTRGTTTGVPEYQLTLDVSLLLRDELEQKGYRVLMIRETNDVDITNAERAQMANEAEADVFVRIHANGSDSSSANGAMTICQTSSNPYNSEYYSDSRRLSELVLDAYTEATGIRRERIWETDTMSGINWCEVPVTILEMGYMTNPEEDTKMQDPDFQETMAAGIADGIEAFLEEKKAESGQNTESERTAAGEQDVTGENTGAGEDTATGEDTAAGEDTASGADTASTGDTASASDTASTASIGDTESVTDPATVGDTASAAGTALMAETASETEPETDPEKAELAGDLMEASVVPGYTLAFTSYSMKKTLDDAGEEIVARYTKELAAQKDAPMAKLEKELEDEIGKLGGSWSLYLKRLDTGRVIGINADRKMVAASLIKLFVAGEFYRQTGNGTLKEESFGNKPDSMINISDNDACNTLIGAVGMKNVNEFARKNGYKATQLNRRMLEFNGTENYTSARDCGVMLEKVLAGKYVSKHASERILEKGLKEQLRRTKIPAGVPSDIRTANKTGELSNVDNDAAIIWSPACTYILCIMSSDTGNRIPEIVKLSSMVYNGLNE